MSIADLREYYTSRQQEFEEIAKDFKKKVFINSIFRVTVFVLTCLLIYILSSKTSFVLLSLLAGIALFLFLVKRQIHLKKNQDHNEALARINARELKYLSYDFKDFDTGEDLSIVDHDYCLDIDLFGKGSFFQYINRTQLAPSRKKLASHLLENNTSEILARQQIIKQLTEPNNWCQNFLAEASLIKSESTEEEVLHWLKIYKPVTNGLFKVLPYLLSGISILMIALFVMGIIQESILVLVLLLGIFISGIKVKQINEIAAKMAKAHDLFEQYSKLLKRIETKDFSCDIASYKDVSNFPSTRIKSFSRSLNSLNQRNNIMVSIFANGFFLRDIWLCAKIDKWIEDNGKHVKEWFSIIHEYDKYISMAVFAFNREEELSYPVIVNSSCIQASNLGHPLIDQKTRVSNDYSIDRAHFNIITGANMAGKSTFLRTVGLSIVMSNCGLPVCADSFEYNPIKLISSMRTTDSLSDNASYFFSELKRLQYIVDKISKEEYFIILDEILKGTNSKDKADGSAKFLRKVKDTSSSGIIATHDLSLCIVANEIETVHNLYFDAEILDDELYFDYQLKEGICKNMNASFLMNKMGIVDA